VIFAVKRLKTRIKLPTIKVETISERKDPEEIQRLRKAQVCKFMGMITA
jgi:hypothetical protein